MGARPVEGGVEPPCRSWQSLAKLHGLALQRMRANRLPKWLPTAVTSDLLTTKPVEGASYFGHHGGSKELVRRKPYRRWPDAAILSANVFHRIGCTPCVNQYGRSNPSFAVGLNGDRSGMAVLVRLQGSLEKRRKTSCCSKWVGPVSPILFFMLSP